MSTYQTADNALSALESRISGLDWQNSESDRVKIREAILDVVKNTSVAAEGSVTALYSGSVNGNNNNFDIAKAMAKDPDVRVLDKTQAFELLSHNKFKDIQAKAFGFESYRLMEEGLQARTGGDPAKYYATPEKVFEGNGKTGLWATISKNFAAETEGAVKIMTELPRADSVLLQTELPELFKNNKITTIDNIDINLIKNTPSPAPFILHNAIQQIKLGDLGSDYSKWLGIDSEDAYHTLLKNADDDTYKAINAAFSAVKGESDLVAATVTGFKGLNKTMGIIGAGLEAFVVITAVKSDLDNGDKEGAKQVLVDWGIEATGSLVGAEVGAALGAFAVSFGGVSSAPLAAIIVAGAAITGGLAGGEGAKYLHELAKNNDENQRKVLIEKISKLFYESEDFSVVHVGWVSDSVTQQYCKINLLIAGFRASTQPTRAEKWDMHACKMV